MGGLKWAAVGRLAGCRAMHLSDTVKSSRPIIGVAAKIPSQSNFGSGSIQLERKWMSYAAGTRVPAQTAAPRFGQFALFR